MPHAATATHTPSDAMRAVPGVVVKLDRGYPLVKLELERAEVDSLIRCEHATTLVKDKGRAMRATIGDRVRVNLNDGHDKGIISSIERRRTAFVRRDPAERTAAQVLAANFDLVIIVEPAIQLNKARLERELVLAHETGASVAVVLTKCDLLAPDDASPKGAPIRTSADEAARIADEVRDLAGKCVTVLTTTKRDPESIARIRSMVLPGDTAILIGKSGVGKSTLVNLLTGNDVQATGSVREGDGKGRHTTVDRVIVELPGGGSVVDMPGIRGLGIWDAGQGLEKAFPDVESLASECRFRDCSHGSEPDCAVQAAVASGNLAPARVESYRMLAAELASVRERRDEARHLRGEKASDRRRRKR